MFVPFKLPLSVLSLATLAAVGCSKQPEPTWSTTSQYRYDVHIENKTLADATTSMFDFDMHAKLAVEPLEATATTARLALTFSDVEITTRQADPAVKKRFEAVEAELARTQIYDLEDGRLTDTRLPKDADPVTVGILRSLVAHFQYAKSPSDAPGFEAEEVDATGRYVARYERTSEPDADKLSFERRKLRYSVLTMDARSRDRVKAGDGPAPKIVKSEGNMVREHGVPVRLSSIEEIELPLLTGRVLLSRTNVEIALLATEPARKPDVAAIERDTVALAADAPYLVPASQHSLDDAKIGGRSFDQVISALESMAEYDRKRLVATRNGEKQPEAEIAKGREWAAGSFQQFIALAALFRRDEANVGRALALVRGGSVAFEGILSSLGQAGTDLSQRALIELMKDENLAEPARLAAGFSLLRAKNPTPLSAAALQGMLTEPRWRSHAVLGLGTFVRKLAEAGDTAASTRFGNVLLGELESAGADKDKIEVLTGISNSGFAGALPAARKLMHHENPEVRAAAVQSVRLMQHPDVDALIAEASRDKLPEIRLAALEALENRAYTPALSTALSARVRSDDESTVRLRALQLVASWASEEPSLRDVLQQAAKNDASESVRQSAETALAQLARR